MPHNVCPYYSYCLREEILSVISIRFYFIQKNEYKPLYGHLHSEYVVQTQKHNVTVHRNSTQPVNKTYSHCSLTFFR